jgi:tRNA1Val (adenine37-N6)-methyltransferase
MPPNLEPLTTDCFFNGRIQIMQNRSGYRFSIDAIILSFYAGKYPADQILDLGTGCGIIPIILAYRNPKVSVYGIEVQKALAIIGAMNVAANQMENQITILCQDMKTLKPNMISGSIDLVVSNPPYRRLDSGRINPNPQRAVARHEIKATLSDVVRTASRMLRISGRFVTIYPAERLTDLFTQMRLGGIEPKFFRMIHAGWKTEAKLVFMEGIKGGRPGVKTGPPLIVYGEAGNYTDEVEEMFMP